LTDEFPQLTVPKGFQLQIRRFAIPTKRNAKEIAGLM
jgi:hypothetical protein